MFKRKATTPEPLTVHLEKNSTTLNIQQGLLLQQQWQRVSMLDRANEHLDNKAISFLQVGALLVAVTGAFNIPDFLAGTSTLTMRGITLLAFLSFGIMIVLSTSIWAPSNYPIPGHSDWDQTIADYLNKNSEDSFLQVLSDLMQVADELKQLNTKKTTRLRWSVGVFLVEVGCVALIACLSQTVN